MRVIFMGTPDFAVPSLEALCAHGHTVAGVLTQPDRPKGRGMKAAFSPVKEAALRLGLPVYQPETLRDHAILPLLEETKPDVAVVVAYGKILPGYVLRYPKYGCVNVHGSLLPKYRGAGPIQAAVINGDTETGVTTMMMARGVDTGDMLLSASTPIGPDDTAETVHDRLMQLGAQTLLRTLEAFENGTAVRVPQNDAEATHAPMLSREDGCMDWTLSAAALYNRARGMTPWPGSFTYAGGAVLKLAGIRPDAAVSDAAPGTLLVSGGELRVVCGDGHTLRIGSVQPAGKRMTPVADFLRGNTLPERFEPAPAHE
ncbi:MAG: methionyl-tRNA formyltransferase [Clostridiaceae bacterium]|nr:methionyl-tRNA formyltransferase [Clostridiales bacterium]MDD6877005.1 methionyl-tRNA formyltransferase [Clostridiaceae bacterium]MDY3072175.1 methionyl-tRNA formyltransferase [Eubacteriales bacterium]MDY3285958.1 methionyl-tRNA formyltransferase [Eubacteriales bacterium]MDY5014754.1 methionyl-tRNA formyltransferase [Eubacteriales bacterium]